MVEIGPKNGLGSFWEWHPLTFYEIHAKILPNKIPYLDIYLW